MLDSGGPASSAPPGSSPSPPDTPLGPTTDVVNLDPPTAGDDEPPLAQPTGRPRRSTRRPAAVALAALVVGALLGGLLTSRQTSLATRAERESTLAVAAQATEVSRFPLPIGAGAELLVTVQNLGPAPVSVVDSTSSSPGARVRRALVTMIEAAPSIDPGGSARVEIRVPIDCRPRRVITARLPVRTADGKEHSVPVTLPDGGRPPPGLCPQVTDNAALQATLTGSVIRPTLQLTNLTDRTVEVSLPPQGLSPLVANSVVAVTTRPSLPVRIPARGELTVTLRFMSRTCVQELQDLQRLDVASLAVMASVLTPGGPVQGGQVPVDVTAVVAAAMVRTCG